jgi:hypothetical protein
MKPSEVFIGRNLLEAFPVQNEWSETRKCFITVGFELCFRICHQEGPRKSGGIGIE